MNFHTDAAIDLDLTPASTQGGEDAQMFWNAMLGEAQRVLHVTLDELALLAGLSTAAIETPTGSQPDPSGRSAYSLLLEPDLFRFPS